MASGGNRGTVTVHAQPDTVLSGFLTTCLRLPDSVALRWRKGDVWHSWTWTHYQDRAARVAGGLVRLGVGAGDRVLLMIGNRPEFHAADLGVLLAGAVPVSVYPTASGEQLDHVATDSGARVAVVETEAQAERLRASGVDRVIALDGGGIGGGGVGTGFTELCSADPVDVDKATATTRPGDLATIIYTSGTTGPAKGVMLGHDTILTAVGSVLTAYAQDWSGRRLLSYLPMAHVAERNTSHYLPLLTGAVVVPVPDATQLGHYLIEVRPHLLVGVPRVFEKLAAALRAAASTDAALVGLDECLVAITGAAPTPDWVFDVLRGAGVPLSEGYGLSECCGTLTLDPYEPRAGTVGRVVPGGELRIAEDGEVLFRARHVFHGYLGNEAASAEAVDTDGWLHTGDVGSVDPDGYLSIVDRKKDLIITSGGKNVAPLPLENALRECPLIAHAVVVGEARPYITALVILDVAAVRAATGSAAPAGLVGWPEVEREISARVEAVNATVSRPERIRRFRILPVAWEPGSAEITPTGKVRRRAVLDLYRADIEALYT